MKKSSVTLTVIFSGFLQSELYSPLAYSIRKLVDIHLINGDSSIGNVLSDRRVQLQVSWDSADILN
jgi:hypothetical protein